MIEWHCVFFILSQNIGYLILWLNHSCVKWQGNLMKSRPKDLSKFLGALFFSFSLLPHYFKCLFLYIIVHFVQNFMVFFFFWVKMFTGCPLTLLLALFLFVCLFPSSWEVVLEAFLHGSHFSFLNRFEHLVLQLIACERSCLLVLILASFTLIFITVGGDNGKLINSVYKCVRSHKKKLSYSLDIPYKMLKLRDIFKQ